jgi:hypothetical protein
MKTICILLILFLGSLTLASGQNYLDIKNIRTGARTAIANDKTIYFKIIGDLY